MDETQLLTLLVEAELAHTLYEESQRLRYANPDWVDLYRLKWIAGYLAARLAATKGVFQ